MQHFTFPPKTRLFRSNAPRVTYAAFCTACALSTVACDPSAEELDDVMFDEALDEFDDPEAEQREPGTESEADEDSDRGPDAVRLPDAEFGRTVVMGPEGPMVVTYRIIDDRALVDGDIDIGPVAELPDFDAEQLEQITRSIEAGEEVELPRAFTPVPLWGQAWPNGNVYYLAPDVGAATIDAKIEDAIDTIEAETDINFIEISPALAPYINHVYFTPSFSTPQNVASSEGIGRQGGSQFIRISLLNVISSNLAGSSTLSEGLFIHELGHAIGLHHEHQRLDRDDYVTVLDICIEPGYEHNFEKRPGFMVGPYDGTSIMHYGINVFALGYGFCGATMLPKPGVVINPGNTLSPGDIAGLDWLASL